MTGGMDWDKGVKRRLVGSKMKENHLEGLEIRKEGKHAAAEGLSKGISARRLRENTLRSSGNQQKAIFAGRSQPFNTKRTAD